MTVERSAVCDVCAHRAVEHDAVGARSCNKLGCRCRVFVDSGRVRVVMPVTTKGER